MKKGCRKGALLTLRGNVQVAGQCQMNEQCGHQSANSRTESTRHHLSELKFQGSGKFLFKATVCRHKCSISN